MEPSRWEDVAEIDAGKPRIWMNFEKPFAELPPIFMPPEPEMVSEGWGRCAWVALPALPGD